MASPRLASQIFEETSSPYLAPSPVWRVRSPNSQRHRLPPLQDALTTVSESDTPCAIGRPSASKGYETQHNNTPGSQALLVEMDSHLSMQQQHPAQQTSKPEGRVRLLEAGRRRSSGDGSENYDSRRHSTRSGTSNEDDEELELPQALKDQLSAFTGSLSTSIVLDRRSIGT